MLEHPFAQSCPFGACSHFLGKDVCIASTASDVSNDGAQQQDDNFHMAQGDVMGCSFFGKRIVPAERVQPFLATWAFPRDVDARQVILANARQTLDEKLSDGRQTQYP
ncbi:hypothetical protein D3C76_832390 [compost metagenome]